MSIILAVTNDLNHDQRVNRIASSLSVQEKKVIVLGCQRHYSLDLLSRPFEQKRLRCFFQKGAFFYAEFNLRLLLFLLYKPFDIVCANDTDTLLGCFLAAKLKQKQLFFDAHEYFTELPELVGRHRVKWIWAQIEKWTLPSVVEAYTVNESLAQLFYKKYKKHFSVIRNVPLKQQLPHNIKKVTPPVVLYQGVLNVGRGLEQMIMAWNKVGFAAELWLAGEGDVSSSLKRLVVEQNLTHRIKFLGKLRPNQLQDITPTATIGLNLLENRGLNYYYSLANKYFDYIQAHVPCICIDFPEYRQLNEKFETALLVPNLESEVLVEAVNRLLADEALYANLKYNCQKAALLWNWQAEELSLLKIYQKKNL